MVLRMEPKPSPAAVAATFVLCVWLFGTIGLLALLYGAHA